MSSPRVLSSLIRVAALCGCALTLAVPLAWANPDAASDAEADVSQAPMPVDLDALEWLEDVGGDEALDWVRAQNERTTAKLEATEGFDALRADLLAILDSDDRIPFVSQIGDHVYNFWRDADHPRGIWRRTTLRDYRKASPSWTPVLDLDALAEAEGENWVWAGARCLRPSGDLCLVSLSRGGADANVTREFDLTTGAFVDGGFVRPEAKGGLAWIDRDTVFVYTDFGEGSMTTSGYPRVVKRWVRGTPMSEATVVYEGTASDMYIAGYHDPTPGFERSFVSRTLAFYNDELYLVGEGGELTQIDAPNSANKSVVRDWLILELREPWQVGGASYPQGALLAAPFDAFMAGDRSFDVLFKPSDTTSLSGFTATRNHLLVTTLEDVKHRVEVLTPRTRKGATTWLREPLRDAPSFGSLSVSALDPHSSDEIFLTTTDFLTPTTLLYGKAGKRLREVKTTPPKFDASGLKIEQHFATSDDGTRVPYFLIGPKDMPLDGTNPTLLYGYGGFEISLTPSYNALVGRGWLDKGGVYVVANIRGGGEYGPRWHQAALKENRLRAYEDFASVASDLAARGVATPERLAIQGGSNGGLLVGNMVTRYPDHFTAAVCAVPLLDMKRYTKLLAGASWMAEYGDPDDPEQWAYIQHFSPFHNVEPTTRYPSVLFTTSTRDDRVHPGHARKMYALMNEYGFDVSYYENIEGGHGGAANNDQSAFMRALWYTYLWGKVGPE